VQGRHRSSPLLHEVLQGSVRNTRQLHCSELGQDSLVKHVDIIVVRHFGKLAAFHSLLLRFKHLVRTNIEARALRERLSRRLRVRYPVIGRFGKLDCLLRVSSFGAHLTVCHSRST